MMKPSTTEVLLHVPALGPIRTGSDSPGASGPRNRTASNAPPQDALSMQSLTCHRKFRAVCSSSSRAALICRSWNRLPVTVPLARDASNARIGGIPPGASRVCAQRIEAVGWCGLSRGALQIAPRRPNAMKAANAFTFIDSNQERLVDELIRFLRIPSISAHKERDADVEAALDYDRKKLESLGFRTEIWPTRSHAGLFAERIVSPDLPTVLIYGHVDVQPVDPVALWTSPPFEPRIADGKIWARGADDNKGQHYAQIAGVEAVLRADGELP